LKDFGFSEYFEKERGGWGVFWNKMKKNIFSIGDL